MDHTIEKCLIAGMTETTGKKDPTKIYRRATLQGMLGSGYAVEVSETQYAGLIFGALISAVVRFTRHPQYGDRWELISYKKLT